jgi:hypothetical protein
MHVSSSYSMKARTISCADRNCASISRVEQLPNRIQMALGGQLSNTLRSAKSESLETIANPYRLA